MYKFVARLFDNFYHVLQVHYGTYSDWQKYMPNNNDLH